VTLCIAAGIAVAVALQATTPPSSAAATPEAILQQVARGATSEVRFTETRTTRLLKAPLTSSGVLRYARPDRLERETLRPTAEKVVIEGTQVTIERNGAQTVMALTSGSAPALLIQTLRAVLSGDWQELESMHKVSATGSLAQWSLQLTPKPDRAGVPEIRVAGRGDQVERIEVLERNGDTTVTTLTR